MKIQIGSAIRHSSFVILLCTGYCVLCTPSARGQPNGLFPETIIAGPGLSSTTSGRTLTLSVTAAGGTTFTPGLNLSLAGGTLNAGAAALGSAAYTNSGTYSPLAGSSSIVTIGNITSGSVPIANMGNMNANSLLGDNTGSAAAPTSLSISSVQTMLGLGSAAYTNSGTYQTAGNYVVYNLAGTGSIGTSGSAAFGALHAVAGLSTTGAASLDGGQITTDGAGNFLVQGMLSVNGQTSLDGFNITTDGAGDLLVQGTLTAIGGLAVNNVTTLDSGNITTNGAGTLEVKQLQDGGCAASTLVYANASQILASVTAGRNVSLSSGTLNVGTATLGSMAYGSTSSASFSGTVTITGSETLTRAALTVATSSSVGTLTVNGLMASADYAATVSGGTCTVNFANGNVQHATLTTSVTLINFTGTPIAGTRYTLVFIQPSSGTDQPTTWTASPAIKWGGGNAPVLTQTSNKADIVSLLYANGNLYGVTSNNF